MGARRRCCCPSCATLVDTFERDDSTDLGANWQECEGDWEILDGHLHIADADAIVSLAGAPLGQTSDGHSVGILTAHIHIFEPAGIPGPTGFTSVGSIYQMMAFYGDGSDACTAQTYWLLELEIDSNTVATMRLYDPNSVLIGTRTLSMSTQWTDFTLCISDNMITGYSTDLIGGPLIWTVHEDLIDGLYFALGCGNSGHVYYETIQYSDQFDHDPTCPDCSEPCCCPDVESEDTQPDLLATVDCSGTSMDGATTTLSCSALPGECCVWQGDDIEFACDGDDDGGLTYKLSIQMECGAPYVGCERYRLTLSWPVGSTNHSWCLGDGLGGEHVEVLVNEPCDCDPLSLTFGPFSLIKNEAQFPTFDYCVCCAEYYIVITEAP